MCERFINLFKDNWHPVLSTICLTLAGMAFFYPFFVSHKGLLMPLLFVAVPIIIWPLKELSAVNSYFKGHYYFTWIDYLIIGIPAGVLFYYPFYKSMGAVFAGIGWLMASSLIFLIWRTYNYMEQMEKTKTEKSSLSSFEYFRVMEGDEPITKKEEDDFERKNFIEEIAAHLINERERNITLGINGSWGMGKTSLVNCIFSELEGTGCTMLKFSSWNYRKQNKVAYYLLTEIKKKLLKECKSTIKLRMIFNNMVQHMSDVSVHGVRFNISFFRNEKTVLKKIIMEEFKIHYPLIVFIDDLDRLDKEEAMTVFRAVRLFEGLPKIKFILAYDKLRLRKLLFLEDETGNLAGDYIGKIVQQEFNLCIPSDDTRYSYWKKLVTKNSRLPTNQESNELFSLFEQEENLKESVFALLITTREIKRVLAATLWIYYLGRPEGQVPRYNLADLFLLTVIQYRLPTLYYDLQRYGPKALKPDFLSSDSLSSLKNEVYNDYYQHAKVILKYLLPRIFKQTPDGLDNYSATLKEKRLQNPDIYHTYFQYAEPEQVRNLFPFTKGLEEVFSLKNYGQPERTKAFLKAYRNELQHKKYWNLFYEGFKKYFSKEEDVKEEILETLTFLEEISEKTSNDYDKQLFSYRAYALLCDVASKDKNKTIDSLNSFIETATYYYFCAFLVKSVTDPGFFNYQSNVISGLEDEEKSKLNQCLLNRFKEIYQNQKILEINFYNLVGLLGWTNIDDDIKDKIISELHEDATQVFNILDIFLNISVEKGDNPNVYVLSNNLKQLDKSVSCKTLYETIEDKINFSPNKKPESVKQQKQIEELINYIKLKDGNN